MKQIKNVRNVTATPAQWGRNVISPLMRIVGPRTWREWGMVSQSGAALVLTAFGYKCHKTTVAHYEGGRPVPVNARKAYSAALDFAVRSQTDDEFTVNINRLWVVTIKRHCRRCPRYFTIGRIDAVNCKRCRR